MKATLLQLPARTAPAAAAVDVVHRALQLLEVDLVKTGTPVRVDVDEHGGVLAALRAELVIDVRGAEISVDVLATGPDRALAASVATARLEGALAPAQLCMVLATLLLAGPVL